MESVFNHALWVEQETLNEFNASIEKLQKGWLLSPADLSTIIASSGSDIPGAAASQIPQKWKHIPIATPFVIFPSSKYSHWWCLIQFHLQGCGPPPHQSTSRVFSDIRKKWLEVKQANVTRLLSLIEVLGDDGEDFKIQVSSRLQGAKFSFDSTVAALHAAGVCLLLICLLCFPLNFAWLSNTLYFLHVHHVLVCDCMNIVILHLVLQVVHDSPDDLCDGCPLGLPHDANHSSGHQSNSKPTYPKLEHDQTLKGGIKPRSHTLSNEPSDLLTKHDSIRWGDLWKLKGQSS